MATKKTATKATAKKTTDVTSTGGTAEGKDLKPAAKATASKAPAKKAAAAGTTVDLQAGSAKGSPTHGEIAALAHRYWNERGGHHGSHVGDWLRAEKELKG